MAATGKTPILLYGSTTATNAPSAGNLTNSSDGCEIAINVADKNLFFKDSGNVVNTVPIRQSSASSNGWLSSTDWSTFNSKQPAGTYVTSVTATAPVVSSGGTTPAISMAAATSSVNGYLTSTDWSTFNNKQAALVSGTNIKTVSGNTLLGSGDVGTILVNYGGTGLTSVTTGYVPFGNSATALATDSNFYWDNTGKQLGIGGVPSAALHVSKASTDATVRQEVVRISTTGRSAGGGTAGRSAVLSFSDANNATLTAAIGGYRYNSNADYAGGLLFFYNGASQSTGVSTLTEGFRLTNTGGVTIGDTTDPGSGNLRLGTGNLVIGTSGKGIDFSATAGTGTSELLADYEEGTWTGALTAVTPPTTPITATGTYTKVGRFVMYNIYFLNVDTTGASGAASVTGLPYTVGATAQGTVVSNAFANPTSTQTAGGGTTASIVISQTAAGASITASTGRYVFITGSYAV